MKSSRSQLRPCLKNGLLYVQRSDGFFVGRREEGLIFPDTLASRVIPLLSGKYSCQEIALLLDQDCADIVEIMDELDRAKLLDHEEPSYSGSENWPELQMITHRPGVVDGGRKILKARALVRIDIYGCGLIGAGLARILAASGIGQLGLIDQRNITSQHLPVSTLASVGLNAATELERSLARDYPKVLDKKIPEPDLVIITRTPSPIEILTWMNSSRPHLLVESRGDCVEVGPLVIPGRSSCLRCLTLDRLDRDPNWYSIDLCGQVEYEPPAALAQIAAGLSALAALVQVDAAESVTGLAGSMGLTDTTLRIDGAMQISALTRRRHPRCGCSWS